MQQHDECRLFACRINSDVLWRGLPAATRQRLLRRDALCTELMQLQHPPRHALLEMAVSGNVELRLKLSNLESMPPEVLVALLQDKSAKVRVAAAETLLRITTHKQATKKASDEWARSRLKRDLPAYLAGQAISLSGLLKKLAEDPVTEVRRVAAVHWRTSAASLETLAGDYDKEVRQLVAANPSTLPKTLDGLIERPDRKIRRSVAAHKAALPQTLAKLAGNADNKVRVAAARNIRTPMKSLATLVTDKEAAVRAAAARSPRLTEAQLTTLAKDTDAAVRLQVARNWKVTKDLLAQLAVDRDPQVAAAAKEVLKRRR